MLKCYQVAIFNLSSNLAGLCWLILKLTTKIRACPTPKRTTLFCMTSLLTWRLPAFTIHWTRSEILDALMPRNKQSLFGSAWLCTTKPMTRPIFISVTDIHHHKASALLPHHQLPVHYCSAAQTSIQQKSRQVLFLYLCSSYKEFADTLIFTCCSFS